MWNWLAVRVTSPRRTQPSVPFGRTGSSTLTQSALGSTGPLARKTTGPTFRPSADFGFSMVVTGWGASGSAKTSTVPPPPPLGSTSVPLPMATTFTCSTSDVVGPDPAGRAVGQGDLVEPGLGLVGGLDDEAVDGEAAGGRLGRRRGDRLSGLLVGGRRVDVDGASDRAT